jgi:hypothetical protein
MQFSQILAIYSRAPDGRPMKEIDADIVDELSFHVEMRAQDNVRAGMPPEEAKTEAMKRFGDFDRIHRSCRRILLGDRIMLQRIQAFMTVVLLVTVVYMGVQFYRWQTDQQASMTQMMKTLDRIAAQPSGPGISAGESGFPKYTSWNFPQFATWEPSAVDLKFPRDAKLTELQRAFRDVSEKIFPGLLNASWWRNLSPNERDAWEEQWLNQLSSGEESTREQSIKALAAVGSKKAVPGILKIAAERIEKDNSDRCEAVRALGIIGERSVVPELVHLTYHYNANTRLWAQISLVRLTGENFGRDVAAWKSWWEKQGGNPPISEQMVAWATTSKLVELADPKKMDDVESQFVQQFKKQAMNPNNNSAGAKALPRTTTNDSTTLDSANSHAKPPFVVKTIPKSGTRDVDPSLAEIRVTFNTEMMDKSWSWCRNPEASGNVFPETTGESRYEADGKTCALPVKLEPGKTYLIVLNYKEDKNFKDREGRPATPYWLQFSTRAEQSAAPDTSKPTD